MFYLDVDDADVGEDDLRFDLLGAVFASAENEFIEEENRLVIE